MHGAGEASEYVYCGIDCKPVLLPALVVSTLIGALCILLVQIPLFCKENALPQGPLLAAVSICNPAPRSHNFTDIAGQIALNSCAYVSIGTFAALEVLE